RISIQRSLHRLQAIMLYDDISELPIRWKRLILRLSDDILSGRILNDDALEYSLQSDCVNASHVDTQPTVLPVGGNYFLPHHRAGPSVTSARQRWPPKLFRTMRLFPTVPQPDTSRRPFQRPEVMTMQNVGEEPNL